MGRTDAVRQLSASLIISLSAVVNASTQQTTFPPARLSALTSKSDSVARPVTAVPPKADGQSWDKFESEFGLQQSDPTLIRGNLRRAKYGLDVVTFATASFLDHAQRVLELEYSRGTVHRVAAMTAEPSSSPGRARAFDDTRLKFDFDLATGKPRIAVRLVIPLGN